MIKCEKEDAGSAKRWQDRTCILMLLPLLVITWLGCNRTDERGQIISKIKKVARLATVEFTIKKTLYVKKEKKIFFIKVKDATFLAKTQAIITAGIDLDEIQSGDIAIRDDSIQIYLPAIRILNFSYPFRDVAVNLDYTHTRLF
ncbi:MAG: DUF4230 domain-containing protein [Candidatus Aminicenantes bacterium]|nr:DUF4230 domain-containing protein [Candidatus Aminicenantes bacterium]